MLDGTANFDLRALEMRVRSGMGLPFGFLR
jgi:hypothetical protein